MRLTPRELLRVWRLTLDASNCREFHATNFTTRLQSVPPPDAGTARAQPLLPADISGSIFSSGSRARSISVLLLPPSDMFFLLTRMIPSADIYTAIALLASNHWSGSVLQSAAAKSGGSTSSVLEVPFSIGSSRSPSPRLSLTLHISRKMGFRRLHQFVPAHIPIRSRVADLPPLQSSLSYSCCGRLGRLGLSSRAAISATPLRTCVPSQLLRRSPLTSLAFSRAGYEPELLLAQELRPLLLLHPDR